jgi:phage recombination protein Bet
MNEENKSLVTLDPNSVDHLMAMVNMPKNQIKREMDRAHLQLLKQANPNLDDIYFVDFISKCQLTGADPRLNQIYLLAHDSWNSQTQRKELKGTVIFNYLFFVQMAQRTGQLEDWGVECIAEKYIDIVTGREKPSYTSVAWVKRRGQAKITYRARFWEFCKTNKDGNPVSNWKVSPQLMLDKCAVANSFRWAFPETFSSFYIQDEMEKAIDAEFSAIPQPMKMNHTTIQQPVVYEAPIEAPVHVEPIESVEPEFERDIEDLRSELTEYLSLVEENFFEKLGKTKDFIVEKIENTKTLQSMKTIYQIVMAV